MARQHSSPAARAERTVTRDAPGALAVRAQGLVLGYGPRQALYAPQLAIPTGQVTAILGPNGSGKSSLLDALSGLLRPSAGRLDVFDTPAGRRDRRWVAYVQQRTETNTLTPVTVREVVRMGRYPARGLLARLTRKDHQAVAAAMERVEITELARRPLAELSGGQQQRVFVAQALAQHAPLLLLDEPLTALDVPSQQRIHQAVAEERRAGRTVVYTTHEVATARHADWAVLLDGTVRAAGPPAASLTQTHLQQAYQPA